MSATTPAHVTEKHTLADVEAALADFRAYLDQREADMDAMMTKLEDRIRTLEIVAVAHRGAAKIVGQHFDA